MSLDVLFASVAQAFSAAGLGALYDAKAKWPGTPTMDDGGSIVAPGDPIEWDCSVQMDSVTEAMRRAEGFTDKDVRLLVLAASLDVPLDTGATIQVLEGPHAGSWTLASVDRDPCGIYFECRGRRA